MQKYLDTLEFPKILSRLAAHTSFSAGRELALSLRPYADHAQIVHHQRLTSEAQDLFDVRPDVTIGGARDVRPLIDIAHRSASLEPGQLLMVRNTLSAARKIKTTIWHLRGRFPLLAQIAELIEECPHVVSEISRCLNDEGNVQDNASPELARLRREIRVTHDRLLERMNKMLTSAEVGRYLQEPLVTMRAGRYVLPIKAQYRGRVKGIVHDQSSSGATLFVEPLATVEMNNRWRELQIQEQQEIDRILLALSGLVSDDGDLIALTVEKMAELDLCFAKAHYSHDLHAVEANLIPQQDVHRPSSGGGALPPGTLIWLREARHPLLNPQTVVPIDIHLGHDFQILLITGPNTGGKTVTLKTVGLLTLMAQAGLHIPAREDSALAVFDGVFADIGDEQSIEQSLSTFSSHMTNIITILKQMHPRSLVLLDELGAGTDPAEGAALARSLLNHMLAKGVPVIATTHYSELKLYAHNTDGVQNASVEFDLETLAPTYKVVIGLPGRSQAFAIASQLGLPASIIEEAGQWVSEEEQHADQMLHDIRTAREEAVADRELARTMLHRAKEREQTYRERTQALQEARETLINKARAEAQRELEATRQQLLKLNTRLAGDALTREWLQEAQQELEQLMVETAPIEPEPAPEIAPRRDEDLQVGDTVFVNSLQQQGNLTLLDGDAAEVAIGQFRVRVRTTDLKQVARPEPEPREEAVTFSAADPDRGLTSMEADIRGMRAQNALPALEKYLDDAYLSGLPWVRIIHGKGTGTLRTLVRERLAEHPLVTAFRSGEQGEGDTGVTIATLIKNR